jgi:transposase
MLRDGTLTSTATVREQVSVADLAQCYEVYPNQLLGEAARAFDAGVGRDAEASRDREIVKLPQLIAERDCLALGACPNNRGGQLRREFDSAKAAIRSRAFFYNYRRAYR